MLYEFINLHRDEIILRCRAKVAGRSSPPPTAEEIDHGVPLFLQQLIHSLQRGVASSIEISDTALLHGQDLLRQGFTVSQVVHDYGDVCQSITELAVETGARIDADDFRVLNGCVDNAVAGAVTEFGRAKNSALPDIDGSHEGGADGFFAHELRNLLNTALIAFEVVKTGNVGVSGSTGAVLHRSLLGARDLVTRSLAGIRLTQGTQHPERLLASQFIGELTEGAMLAANAQGVILTVLPVEGDVVIEVDRQVLGAVMMNVLQNAFKFTRPRSTVTLRPKITSDRVLFEIQDECGGLPEGDTNELFRPFEQRGANRTGLGLGLAFSRLATEVNHGRLYVTSHPGVGCVFTVDLPRCLVPAFATAGSADDV
jgi:hypothetical protein